jgi:hypothetical protein
MGPLIIRPGTWPIWRRIKQAAALLLFTFTALACWNLGLVGFTPS